MTNMERLKSLNEKIDRFKTINNCHQQEIDEHCRYVRAIRERIKNNEDMIENLENEMLFGKDKGEY